MSEQQLTKTTIEKQKLIHNVEEHPEDDTVEYCDRCQNTGSVNCYCGGDQCFCDNQGETYCPRCEMGLEWEP